MKNIYDTIASVLYLIAAAYFMLWVDNVAAGIGCIILCKMSAKEAEA